MSLIGSGKIYRPNDDNSKVLMYIPKELATDSNFPLATSTLIHIMVIGQKVILTRGDKWR